MKTHSNRLLSLVFAKLSPDGGVQRNNGNQCSYAHERSVAHHIAYPRNVIRMDEYARGYCSQSN
jgi:hypothetical protein